MLLRPMHSERLFISTLAKNMASETESNALFTSFLYRALWTWDAVDHYSGCSPQVCCFHCEGFRMSWISTLVWLRATFRYPCRNAAVASMLSCSAKSVELVWIFHAHRNMQCPAQIILGFPLKQVCWRCPMDTINDIRLPASWIDPRDLDLGMGIASELVVYHRAWRVLTASSTLTQRW